MGRGFNLTFPTAAVLLAVHYGHRYGFGIMDATGLPDGTVYPILRRLERRGALEARWEDEAAAHADGRPPRRYYGLTPEGLRVVGEVRSRFPVLDQAVRGLEPGRA